MPHVTYIGPDGSGTTVEAQLGASLMQMAVFNGVPGIVADCGGAASCATCHVYVDESWAPRVLGPGADEDAMLDCAASERRPTSRLSCQIAFSADLDGLIVHIPESQG